MLGDCRAQTLRISRRGRPRLNSSGNVGPILQPRADVCAGDEVAAGLGEGAGQSSECGGGELVVGVEEPEQGSVDEFEADVACGAEAAGSLVAEHCEPRVDAAASAKTSPVASVDPSSMRMARQRVSVCTWREAIAAGANAAMSRPGTIIVTIGADPVGSEAVTSRV